MKKLLVGLLALGSLSAFANELPKSLSCSYELVVVEKKHDIIERIYMTKSLVGMSIPASPLQLDERERTTGESFVGFRGVTIKVNGNSEEAKVQLVVDNGTKASEVLLLNRTIEPRSGLFERLDVPSDRMTITNGKNSNQIKNIILSCLPVY
jgi:hypothetical protein